MTWLRMLGEHPGQLVDRQKTVSYLLMQNIKEGVVSVRQYLLHKLIERGSQNTVQLAPCPHTCSESKMCLLERTWIFSGTYGDSVVIRQGAWGRVDRQTLKCGCGTATVEIQAYGVKYGGVLRTLVWGGTKSRDSSYDDVFAGDNIEMRQGR